MLAWRGVWLRPPSCAGGRDPALRRRLSPARASRARNAGRAARRRARASSAGSAVSSRVRSRLPARLPTGARVRLASFARSRRHRLLYGIYIGVGCAIVACRTAARRGEGPDGATSPTAPLLSVCARDHVPRRRRRARAVRAPDRAGRELGVPPDRARNRPIAPRGGPARAPADRRRAADRAAPPGLHALWGPGVAVAHAVYVLALAWLLVEALMWRFGRVPFTCPYVPGKPTSGCSGRCT